MGHVGGNGQDLARTNDNFFPVDPELERAFQNVSQLFVGMGVLGNDAALFRSTRASIKSWPTISWRPSWAFKFSIGIEFHEMCWSLPLGRRFAMVPLRTAVAAGRAEFVADLGLEFLRDRADFFFMEFIQLQSLVEA